ncbi:GNAT family N-acetyltransferase [Paenibacillus sp. GCM10027629]|uniref:GNAT family N-acetyltransferase n=1 Tax=Paenibacillus sp. GCM10027629 TaxID=3273414 RepID=UPI00362EB056
MRSIEDFEIRRLGFSDVSNMFTLMEGVLSRLPSQELFAMHDNYYFSTYIQDKGEIYCAFIKGELVAYSVLAFPGLSEKNLGREFGVHEQELNYVAVLDGTIVHESVRGRGLQSHFNKLREKRAREKECRYLYSTVHPENFISIKNLETEGFSLKFTRQMYGGNPRHCYAKALF